MTPQVYFIGIKGQPVVKIGFSNDVARRATELYTAMPFVLEEVGRIKGGQPEEAMMHRALVRFRVNGEWFKRPQATQLFKDVSGAESLEAGVATFKARYPSKPRISESQFRGIVAASIARLCETRSVEDIARAVGVHKATIENARRGEFKLKPTALLNLLKIDPTALDGLFSFFGRTTEPLTIKEGRDQ